MTEMGVLTSLHNISTNSNVNIGITEAGTSVPPWLSR